MSSIVSAGGLGSIATGSTSGTAGANATSPNSTQAHRGEGTHSDLLLAEPVVTYEDGDAKIKQVAFNLARSAYAAKQRGEIIHWKDCAQMIKESCDKTLGPTWHCVVGTHFGSFICHETSACLLFNVAEMQVLLFKHG